MSNIQTHRVRTADGVKEVKLNVHTAEEIEQRAVAGPPASPAPPVTPSPAEVEDDDEQAAAAGTE
ncbi:hypothetical protein [Stratiformator vulcanicus]|uniref:Uncharacterized protein n=1 Tax=Stratiformator vulcanicus TaxID=2527980 RepID=A0A517R766_9PLAN|nr:hypothetical protein [Stratiformator vulcanicus]QDT39725.1 hypothetical protein Pan189_41340 [Stratiformator vulcanicus]